MLKYAKDVDLSSQYTNIMYVTDQGLLRYGYRSKMNVPFMVKIYSPTGEEIYSEEKSYMYKSMGDEFFIAQKINGTYIVEITQDGQTVKNEYEVDIF